MKKCDVLIIGAGPGGLAAAEGAKKYGAGRVIVLERDSRPGGILNQCIHDGFGLVRYNSQLTGPEYAIRAVREALTEGAEILTSRHVISIAKAKAEDAADPGFMATCISEEGLEEIYAKAIVMATGCRERTRGAISIPGSRPAGVFTAGVVQNFVNLRNIMPGNKVVILGSGDVGMIMARRLSLEGAQVKAVIEIMPQPAGLARNVSQCIYDYGIPLYCGHTVSKINGSKRLTSVEVSELDGKMRPVPGTEQVIECDTLVISAGLIPENEVAKTIDIALDEKTNGVITDSFLQTSVPGIFSCGNSRKILDLADFVSEQGEAAGSNAAAFALGRELSVWQETPGSSMEKGYPQEGVVTCIFCPKGCSGPYQCSRGEEFARREKTDPVRFLTTTVRVSGYEAKLLAVRSQRPVLKRDMKMIIGALAEVSVDAPVNCGDEIARLTASDGEEIRIIASGSTEGLPLKV
ncbi:MAG: FAD-dependent oxidoreductase [Bacillota bacterium]|nr:FAD-dependent oxidoreductase [Bacillota bacterium]